MPFSALSARGVTATTATRAEAGALAIGGVTLQLTAARVTEYTFGLPRAPSLQLVFTKETLRSALSKVLWPEVELGDPAFDDVVVARTSTEAATRAFLHDAEARALVVAVVGAGGAVSVEGPTVRVVVPDRAAIGPRDVAAFVERLL